MSQKHQIGDLVVYLLPYDVSLSHSIGIILEFNEDKSECLVFWSKPTKQIEINTRWHTLGFIIVIDGTDKQAKQISESRSGGLGLLK